MSRAEKLGVLADDYAERGCELEVKRDKLDAAVTWVIREVRVFKMKQVDNTLINVGE